MGLDTVGAATGAGVPDMGGAEDAPLEQKPRLPRLLIEAERIVMTRLARRASTSRRGL